MNGKREDLSFEFSDVSDEWTFIPSLNRFFIEASFTKTLPYGFIAQRAFETQNPRRIVGCCGSNCKSSRMRTRHPIWKHSNLKPRSMICSTILFGFSIFDRLYSFCSQLIAAYFSFLYVIIQNKHLLPNDGVCKAVNKFNFFSFWGYGSFKIQMRKR